MANQEGPRPDALDAYVFDQEHAWLLKVYRSELNASPKFRIPDLIGSCISIVTANANAEAEIFQYMGSSIVLRSKAPRRQTKIWMDHAERLQRLQRSPANSYPNPSFSLDQLITACVALARAKEVRFEELFDQARINMAARYAGKDSSGAVVKQ